MKRKIKKYLIAARIILTCILAGVKMAAIVIKTDTRPKKINIDIERR